MSSNIPAAAAAAASKAATAAAESALAAFKPRRVFEVSPSITRSYYLGHHQSGLSRMQRALSNVGLIIECRDFRVPLTAWNPHLESHLAANPADRARVIVYTKRDLGPPTTPPSLSSSATAAATADPQQDHQQSGSEIVRALTRFHRDRRDATAVVFMGQGHAGRSGGERAADARLFGAIKDAARDADALTGLRAMVVGMPNAGKSTLLNRLRALGMGRGLAKAARTGAEPGVTRKLGTPVRIVPREEDGGVGEGVYLMDTPGVFVPYVADGESMLKLALVGCVKDGLVPHVSVADYLLFRLNLRDPALYARYCTPTNDVGEFLAAVARRTGKLLRGGMPGIDAAADWIIKEWRKGDLGRFILDDVTPETLDAAVALARSPALSMNQARKRAKEQRKAKSDAKRLGMPVAESSRVA